MQFSEAYDFGRAVSHGFEAFKRAWPPMFFGGVLMTVLDGGCQGGGGGGGEGGDAEELQRLIEEFSQEASLMLPQMADGLQVPAVGASLGGPFEWGALAIGIALVVLAFVFLIVLVVTAIRSFVFAGFLKVHREILETGTSSVGTLFSGADRTLGVFGYALLSMLIMSGVFGIAGAPAGVVGMLAWQQQSASLAFAAGGVALFTLVPAMFYVQLGLSLGTHAVVFEDEGPIGALERSWELTSGNRLWLLLFGFVMFLLMMGMVLGGVMALCIGVFVFVPIGRSVVDFGYTESFLMLTRPPEERAAWQLGGARG